MKFDVLDRILNKWIFFSFHIRNFVTPIIELRCAHRQESDRTLRDGSFEVVMSRHFVPGYDRTVAPGQ
jgi:hypothetical protein